MGRGRPRHPDILTPREWEVLALVRDGLTNPEIAERLGITLAGARYHVSEILSKLGVATREEAALWEQEEAPARRWSLGLWAKVALGATAVAVLAGLGALAWGVLQTRESEGDTIGRVAFVWDQVAGETQTAESPHRQAIWLINEDGTGLEMVVELDPDLTNGDLSWSDDGQTIRFIYGDYRYEVRGDGSGLSEVEPIEAGRPDLKVYSPDGKLAVYYRGLTPVANGVEGSSQTMGAWIQNRDGTDDHKLVPGDGYTEATDWSADGSTILMNCADDWLAGEPSAPIPGTVAGRMDPVGVCTVRPDGSGLTEVIAKGGGATWSPDERSILYYDYNRRRIMIADADGSNQRRLTEADSYCCGESFATWWQPNVD